MQCLGNKTWRVKVVKDVKTEETKEYSLYTENIEKKKAHRLRHNKTLKTIINAVIFGVVASFVMALLFPVLHERFKGKEELKIVCEERSVAEMLSSDDGKNNKNDGATGSDENFQSVQFAGLISSLKKVSVQIQKSVFTINIYENGLSEFQDDLQNVKKTVGLIIGEVNGRYMILTDYNSIKDKKLCLVAFSDSTQIEATYVGSYPDLGIAVLSVDKSLVPSYYNDNVIKTANFDNSFKTEQGDIVIAAGKFSGKSQSIEYGFIINTETVSYVDNEFRVINTGITCLNEDYGFLFSASGNVIGVMSDNLDGKVSVYGISSIKTLVEDIANGNEIVYMGVNGENVTGVLSTMYDLPMGIYIHQIDIDSPAYQAGLQPGDIITSINGNMTLTFQAFSEKLYQCSKGQQVTVNVKRKGKDKYKDVSFTVTLGVR